MKQRPAVMAGIVFLAGVAVTVATTRSHAAPNQVIQHQGKLVDSNGVPLQGSFTVRFRIYRSPTPSAADFVWGERHTLQLNRGVYTAHLGAGEATIDAAGNEASGPHAFTDEFDAGDPRWIEVQVGTDPPLSPLSQIGAVPFSIASAGTVPIGTVIAWWPPAPGAGVPAGYEYCDGTQVVTEGPLKDLHKPDLMGTQRFIRGISMSDLATFGGAAAFRTGGEDTTPAHQHAVPGLASHTHRVRGTTIKKQTQIAVLSGVDDFVGAQVTWDHTHDFDVVSDPATSAASNTGLSGEHDNRPRFVELAYIVRVR